MPAAYAPCLTGKGKGGPSAAPSSARPVHLCGPGVRFAQTHPVRAAQQRPPPAGGYPKTTKSGAAARPRFKSPVRESRSKFVRPRRTGPSVSLESASAASGRSRLQLQYRRSEEHTSELQSLTNLVCRLLLEKKKTNTTTNK